MEAAPAVLAPPRLTEAHPSKFRSPQIHQIPAERLAAKVCSPWRRVLVAGVGDGRHGDHSFGPEVARRLARRPLPPGVEVIDFSSRGLDVVYALRQGYEAALLLDTSPYGEAPGTLTVIEPDLEREEEVPLDPSALDPVGLVRFARLFGSVPRSVTLVVCEPAEGDGSAAPRHRLDPVPIDHLRFDHLPFDRMPFDRLRRDPVAEPAMSPAVAAAVRDAVPLVESLIAEMWAAGPAPPPLTALQPAI